MTAPFLYVNSRGFPHRKHSYSAGMLFDKSPYAYYLQKVLGWRERDNKARFCFGKAIEESIQAYHERNSQIDIVEDFVRRWAAHKENGDMTYTDVEKDWANCEIVGKDMVRLYRVRQPSLPIPLGGNSVFQREYSKVVFEGDPNYGEIEDAGRLDIVCYIETPNHPLLPRTEWESKSEPFLPLIVDIKTSALDFPEQMGMAAYDTQLRRYSWLSGIRTVAFLWFVKKGLGYKKGYSVTLLEATENFKAGQEAVIAKVDGDHAWVVYNDFMLEEMDRAQGKKGDKLDQTDVAKERALNWLKQNGTFTPLTSLTKQRLQFNAGLVSEQSAAEAGQIAARQIVSIVNASKNNQWPNTFGIRYPHDDRNDSYFRAFVLKEEAYRNQNFIKSDEQSFDDLFREEEV